jgi:prepilin-type N-terminal cleavage/methylation domain-containing protein
MKAARYLKIQKKKMSAMKPYQQQGFTLIEIMVVVAIMGIFSMIAIPNFISWLPRHRLSLAAQDVASGLIKARSRAVKDDTVVVFGQTGNSFWAFADDGAGSVDGDLNGIPDDAGNGTQEGNEQTVVSVPLPSGITITASFQTVFDRRGFPSAPGTITLRNSKGSTRDIDLSLAGNVQVGAQIN